MAKLTRRGFLKVAGGVAAGLGVAETRLRALGTIAEAATEPEPTLAGPERWVTTVCGECSGGCGIRVRVVGERAVGIAGNPIHPVNRGGLCPRGLAGLQALYNPDRVRSPLRRKGPRGSGQFEPISWEEAIKEVADRLRKLRRAGRPHSLVVLCGQPRGTTPDLLARFCEAFGTPNFVVDHQAGTVRSQVVNLLTQGLDAPIAYDFARSRFVLSFGAPLLEGGLSPVYTMQAFGRARAAEHRVRLVQIEPRLSPTAAKADQWVAISPGTEGALALGIAYVLIREGLYDRDFVASHTFGFEDWRDDDGQWHRGLRSLVLAEYNPDAVSRITGVPVATILRVAKAFGQERPAVAVAESQATNGVLAMLAVHALNALAGSINVPGGVVVPPEVPLAPLPPVSPDPTARRGLSVVRLDGAGRSRAPLVRHSVASLAAALRERRPYEAGALFLYYANPAYTLPASFNWEALTANVPLVVTFSPYLDQSAALADFVLPDHTYLERWEDDPLPPLGPWAALGIRRPAVKPVWNTMATGDVVIQLARALGDPIAGDFPWKNTEEVLRHRLHGLFTARRGSAFEAYERVPWAGLLAARGWWYPGYRTEEQMWEQLTEAGGWWDPVSATQPLARVFRTPSGRFEFWSQLLRDRLRGGGRHGPQRNVEEVLGSLGVQARGDLVYLPHHEQADEQGSAAEYPFFLHIYRPLPLGRGRNANQPFLPEIVGTEVGERWESWVELSPEDARRLRIVAGQRVRLESSQGRVVVKAAVRRGLTPGVVAMPLGLGHEAYGRWARGIGVNPRRLAGELVDGLAGTFALQGVRVRIERA